VDRVSRKENGFVVSAGGRRLEAENVIVAMANYQRPRIPAFGDDLDPSIVQLHSQAYRNPSQLRAGGALVVGAGNSGADIAVELARTHRTWISGRESGHVPFPIDSALGRFVLLRLVRFVGHHLLTLSTPIGRRMRPRLLSTPAPLVRVKPADLAAAGVERVPRVVGVRDGRPLLADGRTLEVASVIWCTGYHPGFSWIDLPVFGEDGRPRHHRGIVADVPGLYFVGLHYLYAMTSATLIGVGRDAERVVRDVERRSGARRAA
jgi:putative flavoprotein involved in K+ transport